MLSLSIIQQQPLDAFNCQISLALTFLKDNFNDNLDTI